MPFVWRELTETGDLLWVARGYAEAVAAEDWEEAWQLADLALEVSQGGYVRLDREDGGCRAMTRQAQYCPHRPRLGEEVCGLHARLIKRHHQSKETTPPDREEP
jgi:hypothetical protein